MALGYEGQIEGSGVRGYKRALGYEAIRGLWGTIVTS